jgi:hypothetical protein
MLEAAGELIRGFDFLLQEVRQPVNVRKAGRVHVYHRLLVIQLRRSHPLRERRCASNVGIHVAVLLLMDDVDQPRIITMLPQ